MRKVVFLGMPAHGHTNPTLAVVKELIERGIKVVYYNTERFREVIERVGAEFKPYRVAGLEQLTSKQVKSKDMHKLFTAFMLMGRELVEEHVEEVGAEHPDCIVFDSMFCPGATIAKMVNVPAVSSNTTFAINDAVNVEMFKAASLSEKFTFIGLLLFMSIPKKKTFEAMDTLLCGTSRKPADMHKFTTMVAKYKVVYTSRAFQPKAELFDEDYHFVGPSIIDREEVFGLSLDDRPLIYISIGTVMDNPKFFETSFRAFGDGKYRVLLSVGKGASIEDLGPIPENFIVKNYFPQLEVLKRSDLFVSHCGMNSAHESIYHGVPIIGLPQTAEQALVAKAVDGQGAGIYLRKMDAKRLRAAAENILADSSYRENCLRLQKGFKAGGGAARAAEVIMKAAGISEELVGKIY